MTETTTTLFEKELESIINRYSQENGSNTPDWILAEYLVACLKAWNTGVQRRQKWYGLNETFIESAIEASEQGAVKGTPTYALENIRLLAAREKNYSDNVNLKYESPRASEMWGHVLRFCRDAGIVGSILREEQLATAPSGQADDESLCALCGWPLREFVDEGCVRGNCSFRPLPSSFYSPLRADKEYSSYFSKKGDKRVEPQPTPAPPPSHCSNCGEPHGGIGCPYPDKPPEPPVSLPERLLEVQELLIAAQQLAVWVDDPWIESGAKNAGQICYEVLIERRERVESAALALEARVKGGRE